MDLENAAHLQDVEEVISAAPESDENEPQAEPADESIQQENEPVSDQPEATEEVSEEAQEAKSLEDRFEEFTKELKEEEESEDPEKLISREEAQLSAQTEQLKQLDVLQGLPQSGVFAPDGQLIYAMNKDQINDYILKLQDQGHVFDAQQVANAYNAAVDRVTQLLQHQQTLEVKKQEIRERKQSLEWGQVEEQWLATIPELKDEIPKISRHLRQKIQQDPAFALLVETQAGKMKAVFKAIQELGIDRKLSANKPKAEIKTPSAPDAQAVSKKVVSNKPVHFTREQIAKMDLNTYLKYEKEIDEAMAKGLIR